MALIALVVLVLDQLTKAWIASNMAVHETREIVEGVVRLRYTQNTGAAFGFFQGWTGALSIAAATIVVAILMSATRVSNGNRANMLALGLVLGGALGNLADRVRLGYVVDFFEVHGLRLNLNDTVYTWPVFNVADSAITIGVILLIVTLIFGKRESEQAIITPAMHAEQRQPEARFTVDHDGLVRPTPAGWAGLAVVLGGFLLMALRAEARSQESGGR
jgi:signal peptidase II